MKNILWSNEDMEEEDDDEEVEFKFDTKRALEGYGEEKIETWLSSFASILYYDISLFLHFMCFKIVNLLDACMMYHPDQ